MDQKRNISIQIWTSFWNSLGVYERKRNRTLQNYNHKNDYRLLSNAGVDRSNAEKVYRIFSVYKEPLLFHKFVLFFRKDPTTVKIWTGAQDTSEAFMKLFNIFHYNSFFMVKNRFLKLFLLYELNRKGEGRKYILYYKKKGSIPKLDGVKFTRTLNRNDKKAVYKFLGRVSFEGATIICLKKHTGDRLVYKFIKLIRENGKIVVKISADSSKEFDLICKTLQNWFGSYIDTPQIKGSFKKLVNFLNNGESNDFLLTGVSYFQDNYKIAVFPKYNIFENIALFSPYKKRMETLERPEDDFVKIRILHKEIPTKRQIFVNFLNYQTSGIMGAIVLNLEDRNLNSEDRKKIRLDFSKNFNLPLNEFITCRSFSKQHVYKKLLQNTSERESGFELRSEEALGIYKDLISCGLLPFPIDSYHQARICTYEGCTLAFQIQMSGQVCTNCGGRLLDRKRVTAKRIDEKKIINFIQNTLSNLDFSTVRLERKLLNRKIFVLEIRAKENWIEVIPITKPLNHDQLEILRFRYPNLLLLTSRDDMHELAEVGIFVDNLYNIAYILQNKKFTALKKILKEVNGEGVDRIRNYSKESSKRLTNNKFYIDKNKESKNFGSELFEADCSILLNFIFGNSIWLGARTRGQALPDGMAAFPMTDTKSGCFIWDSKFYESKKVKLGDDEKNNKYIFYARGNKSISMNGGLKGFVFISNKNAPKHFITKYRKFVGKRRIKVSFIKAKHLYLIFKHYKNYENKINTDIKVKQIFIDSMSQIFFNFSGENKSFVLQDKYLNSILANNIKKYKSSKTGSLKP